MLCSILIPFHTNRIDNLLQTIRFLERNDPEVASHSELLLLCHDKCGDIDTRLFPVSRVINIESMEMDKPAQLNRGAKEASSDLLLFLDSDRILPPGYFRKAMNQVGPGKLVTTDTILNLDDMYTDERIASGDFTYSVEMKSRTAAMYARCAFSGHALMTKDDYWKAGGMDVAYVGYGFEDTDMMLSLEKIGVQAIFNSDPEVHLYHERMSYGSTDQKKFFIANGIRLCKKWGIQRPIQFQQEINGYTKNLI